MFLTCPTFALPKLLRETPTNPEDHELPLIHVANMQHDIAPRSTGSQIAPPQHLAIIQVSLRDLSALWGPLIQEPIANVDVNSQSEILYHLFLMVSRRDNNVEASL